MRLVASLLAAALLAGAACAAEPVRGPALRLVQFERPVQAPGFVLDSLSGTRLGLAEYRGRVVLLNFWATWCPPCLEEMPSMEALYQRLRQRGMVVLAVSSDEGPPDSVRRFTERLGVTFPVLLDRDGAVSASYGARNLPASFVLDRGGRVIAAALGARDRGSADAMARFEALLAQ